VDTKYRYDIAPVTAVQLGTKVVGDPQASACQVASLENANADCLVFCLPGRLEALADCQAAIVLAPASEQLYAGRLSAQSVVWVDNPMLDFVRILLANGYTNDLSQGQIMSGGYYLADDATVGMETQIFPMATVHSESVIGSRCRIQSGATIGAVGLGYAVEGENESYVRFPHLGHVVIGDDVDIGAGTTVVRGILHDTVVGSGSRIGNNVNIGHNVQIGKDCFVSSGVVLAGSVRLEDKVWIAPNVTLLNGVTVGVGAKIGAGALLSKDAEPGYLYLGSPARAVKKECFKSVEGRR